jgi:hypothetical protein
MTTAALPPGIHSMDSERVFSQVFATSLDLKPDCLAYSSLRRFAEKGRGQVRARRIPGPRTPRLLGGYRPPIVEAPVQSTLFAV